MNKRYTGVKYTQKLGIMKIKLVQFCFCLFACSGGAESLVAEKSVCGVCVRGAGKVPQIRGNWVHFPRKNGENGGRINISGGKVPQIPGKMVHFP